MHRGTRTCILVLTGLAIALSAGAEEPVRVFSKHENHFFRIPGLAVTTKGTLLAFAGERKGSLGDFGHDTDVVLRRSTDGGATWSTPETILSEKGVDFHAGPVVVDRRTGSIFKFARSCSTKTHRWGDNYVLRSDDDGKTWTKSMLELENRRATTRFGPGNGGHGIQLANGRLVIHGGYWRVADGKRTLSLCLIESLDRGKTWQLVKGSDLDRSHVEFCMAETAPGRIYLNIREKYTPARLYTTMDLARPPIADAEQVVGLPSTQCRAGMVKVEHGDAVWLYFTGPTGTGNNHSSRRVNLSLFRSDLEGKRWQRVALLHQGKTAYSDLTALPDGDLACLYEAGKANPYEEILFLKIPKETYLPNKADAGDGQ